MGIRKIAEVWEQEGRLFIVPLVPETEKIEFTAAYSPFLFHPVPGYEARSTQEIFTAKVAHERKVHDGK